MRRNKALLMLGLLCLLIFVGGCETLKGAGKGASEGAKKDWEKAQEVDVWMRKNLW